MYFFFYFYPTTSSKMPLMLIIAIISGLLHLSIAENCILKKKGKKYEHEIQSK